MWYLPSMKKREPTSVAPPPRTAALMQRTGAAGELPDGRSDLRRYALVEGEVADLVRSQLDPVADVVANPVRGHRDR